MLPSGYASNLGSEKARLNMGVGIRSNEDAPVWGMEKSTHENGLKTFVRQDNRLSKDESEILDTLFGEIKYPKQSQSSTQTSKSNMRSDVDSMHSPSLLERFARFLRSCFPLKKSAFAFILLFILCAFEAQAANYKTEVVNGITWKYTNPSSSTSTIYGYMASNGSGYETAIPTWTSGDVVIPSTLGGKPVTRISNYAFYLCANITSVVIPDTVTYVGQYAFQGCSKLEKIVVGKSVSSTGRYAFSTRQLYTDSSSLKTIIIRGGRIAGESSYYITDRREGITVYVNSNMWSLPATWEGYSVQVYDPIPAIGSAVAKNINEALYFATDGNLKSNVNTAEKYSAFRAWADGVCGTSDMTKRQSVMDSSLAWLSFAVDAGNLIATAPQQGELKIDDFKTNEIGNNTFDFEISVENLVIGEGATADNLTEVFSIEGSTTIDGEFSPDNVELSFGTPENGKVKCTAIPKDPTSKSFFMRAKMNP